MRVPTKRIASIGQNMTTPLQFHCLCQQHPFVPGEFLDGDCCPDPDVHEEELEGQVDDALHGWRNWDCVFWPLGVLDSEDGIYDACHTNVDADHDDVPANCKN